MSGNKTKPARGYGLSKSRITAFEQCPKKLWLSVHKRDFAQPDPQSELRFAAGHQVGAIACDLTPGGVMIEAQPNLAAALQQTAELIAEGHRRPIYEATFSHDGWSIAEVKSSTGAKDYHVGDLATQVWVLENCQIKVRRASVRHIDNGFVLQRASDYSGLLKDAPLDAQVAPIAATRAAVVADARATLGGPEPATEMGAHCTKPFLCEFQAYCGNGLPAPPEWPVSILPRTGRKIAHEMAARGIFDLRDVPVEALKSRLHQTSQKCDQGLGLSSPLSGLRDDRPPSSSLDWYTPLSASPLSVFMPY